MAENKTDEELMVMYQLGDEVAFAILYERYSSRVFSFLRSRLGTEAMARDVFQSSFLKLHKTRDKYEKGLPFAPWLFMICRNEMIDAFRKKGRNLEDATESVPDQIQSEVDEALEIDLTGLPDSQKEAIHLRYKDELPFEVIAKRLDTTPTNARQLVSRGLKALRRAYGGK